MRTVTTLYALPLVSLLVACGPAAGAASDDMSPVTAASSSSSGGDPGGSDGEHGHAGASSTVATTSSSSASSEDAGAPDGAITQGDSAVPAVAADAGVDATPAEPDAMTASSSSSIDAGAAYVDPTCAGLSLDGWPRDSDGWTVLPAVTQTGRRIIYVSSGNGSKTSPDPSNPDVYYVTTAEAGVALLRAGEADSLLFNRGETFNLTASIDSHGLSGGTTADQAKVVGAYGSGPRPILVFNQAHSVIAVEDYAAENLIITQLDLEPDTSLSQQGTGVTLSSASMAHVLVEDVKINGFQKGMDIEQGTDVVVRRSEILNSCGGYRSQGIYVQNITGFTLDENYMDQNGLQTCGDPTSGSPEGQGVYFQSMNACLRAEGNVMSRSLGNTLEARVGGTIQNNVFIGSSTALNYGLTLGGSIEGKTMPRGVYGQVTGNVFLNDGIGVQFGNTASTLFSNNVIAATTAVGAAVLLESQDGIGVHGLTVSDNAVSGTKYFVSYQWGLPAGPVVMKYDPTNPQWTDCDGVFTNKIGFEGSVQIWQYVSTQAPSASNGNTTCYVGLSMNGAGIYADGSPSTEIITSVNTGILMQASEAPVYFTAPDALTNNRAAATTAPFENSQTALETNPAATTMPETGDDLHATFANASASIADILGTEDAFYAAMAAQSHDAWNAKITAAAVIPYFQAAFAP